MWWCLSLWWDAQRNEQALSLSAFSPQTESLISAHDILSWIKQEEQPYPWGPRDSMDGELGLDSGPGEWGTQLGPWVFGPEGWLLTHPAPYRVMLCRGSLSKACIKALTPFLLRMQGC